MPLRPTPRLRIALATPRSLAGRSGNRTSALRWAKILRHLGHRVCLSAPDFAPDVDLLIALHARKSASAVASFREKFPGRPVLIALTGTDLYGDAEDKLDPAALEAATRLIVLQPLARDALAPHLQNRARIMLQSSPPVARDAADDGLFRVLVVGHLRTVKDPFRAARAARLLPASSRVQVRHLGRALDASFAAEAEREMAENPRYVWRGERSGREVREELAKAQVLVQSSWSEGGANTVSEALAAKVPILASRVDGNEGLLGPSYPGYFPAGSTQALRDLLHEAEHQPSFLQHLKDAVTALAPLFQPEEEVRRWKCLLRELFPEPELNPPSEPPASRGLEIITVGTTVSGASFAEEVLSGLSAPRKSLPCRWFYDEAGSRLFELICELPEYEVTRAEVDLLR